MINLFVLALVVINCWGLYPNNSNVIELNPSNFDKLVVKRDEVWIVQFFAPWCGHCKALIPEYIKTCNALKGIIKVGAINVDKHRSLGTRFGIQGFPTIKIFGANKNLPEHYNGARTAQDLADKALAVATRKVLKILGGSTSFRLHKDVIELTNDNFDQLVLKSEDMWLVDFFAPWCNHCKKLVPHWAKAAVELKGRVKLGAIDATIHKAKASEYGIEVYPTITFFPKNGEAITYNGEHNSRDIVNWSLEKREEYLPTPKIEQLVKEELFEKVCRQKTLCLFFVLPHILDCSINCRNNYIQILNELKEEFKKKSWGWVWSEAGAQNELENALDIGGFGYPAMVAVNTKKMRYSILRGPFSKKGIQDFLKELSYNKGNTFSLRSHEVPKIKTINPWDGKNGRLVLEENDLSHVNVRINNNKDEL